MINKLKSIKGVMTKNRNINQVTKEQGIANSCNVA